MADTARRRGSHFATGAPAQTDAQTQAASASVQGSGTSASASSSAGRHAAAHAASAAQTYAAPATQASSTRRAPRFATSGQSSAASGRSRARAGSGQQTQGMQSLATPRTRAQRAAQARGGHSRAGVIVGALAALVVVVLVGVFVVPRFFAGSDTTQEELPNQGERVELVIEEGSGALAIAAQLADAGIISSADDFVTEVQRKKAESSLQSGAYIFQVGQDYDAIINLLTTGPNTVTQGLTIPEGRTVTQTAAAVEEALGISADDFIAQAKASNYVADYPFLEAAAATSYDSLEGYLWPKTYDFSMTSDLSADTVIRTMLDQYALEVASLDFAGAEASIKERYGVEMSDYDIITLASIVEREAVTDDQRANISSTFFNRLEIGMALQSDASYMYVTGGEVSYEDLTSDPDNPYNTRFNTGLTPTPICSPSIESITATLYPNDTDYLYFYITSDTEQFSATYDEHLSAQN